jgi:DUF4097 and DUF4098 domain-containing protein YvlB
MGNADWKLILVAAVAATAACAQEARYAQEGPFWVRTLTVEAPVHTRLIASARAKIVLRASNDSRLVYKLVQRVRARDETEARRLMPDAMGMTDFPGDATRLSVTPFGSAVASELELLVPRQVMTARLESLGGDIEAYDFDGSVDAATMFGQIRCDRIGGNFNGRTGGGEIHIGKIGGSVRCSSGGGQVTIDSAGGDANCATAGGDMLVQDAHGPLLLSTEGNIRVTRAASSVEAHSAAGIIEVGAAGGAVNADTRSGSIQIGAARGVRAESAQGGVRLRAGSGPLSVSTAAGSILAELLSGARLENSTLTAGRGDITVFIPSNVPVTIMARNDSSGPARIISDFAEIHVQNGLIQSPVSAQGALNGGGPVLFINAASGVIYLRKTR